MGHTCRCGHGPPVENQFLLFSRRHGRLASILITVVRWRSLLASIALAMSAHGLLASEAAGVEAELLSAITLYQEQLEQLDAVLAENPENEEVGGLRGQLIDALDDARAALRACMRSGLDSQGNGYATSASAAAGMEIGAEEEGQEASSSAPPPDAALGDAPCSTDAGAAAGPHEAQSHGVGPTPVHGARLHARRTRPGNSRMHPSNKYYHEEPDFVALAKRHPELSPYVTIGPNGRAHFSYTR